MERIKEALDKAKILSGSNVGSHQATSARQNTGNTQMASYNPLSDTPTAPMDSTHLEGNRIISYLMKDTNYVAFNILRTKVYQSMTDNGWKSLAISSPNPGAGKTTIAVNLAFSLARQKNFNVVLVDLDLRRPAVAKTLGIDITTSIGQYLSGNVEISQCAVSISKNLIAILNDQPVRGSSELMSSQWGRQITTKITEAFAPDVIIYDLPPMLSSDDTMSFLPFVDCGLSIIDDGGSKYSEVEQCDKQFSAATNLIGHVLNKSTDKAEVGYNYYDQDT